MERNKCIKCKEVKDSVSPKIVSKVMRASSAEALVTKLLCDECYAQLKDSKFLD
jgi:hypothetical protein